MATNTDTRDIPEATGPAAGTQPPASSVILAMNLRYDAAWEEYNRAEEAQIALSKGEPSAAVSQLHLDQGMRESSRESDLLRLTILHQVPETDDELSILLFHAWGLFDLDRNSEKERVALGQALTSTLHYVTSNGRVDLEKMGRQFTNGAMIADSRVCARTGLIDAAGARQ